MNAAEISFIAIVFLGAILWVAPIWVICGRLTWHPVLSLLVFIPLVGLVFSVMTIWEALGKAQQSRWLVFVLLVPLANVVFVYWLAFGAWPPEMTPAAPA